MRHQDYPSEAEFDAEGNVISAEDWLGNRFGVGDLVMYCISAGRGQMMAIGKVQSLRIDLNTKTKRVSNPDWVENRDPWRDHTIIVPAPTHEWVVQVQILTDCTSGHWSNERRTRPAWVNEMNITAIRGIEGALL